MEKIGDKNFLVFQNRVDSNVNFYRGWSAYSDGFGDPSPGLDVSFWLGLNRLSDYTVSGTCTLRLQLWDKGGNSCVNEYSGFKIGTAPDKFPLLLGSRQPFNSGGEDGCGLGLEYHKDMRFSTFDQDND